MRPPVLLAVDVDEAGLADVQRELDDRYARHYEVLCLSSAAEARERLETLAGEGVHVALVLAARELGETTGVELLGEARRFHPQAKRALLIAWGEWGDAGIGAEISEATIHARIDHHLVRPLSAPDERFHHAVSSFLVEWADDQRVAPHAIHVVGDSWSGRAYELRSTLERCALPHRFTLADSPEGSAILAEAMPNRPLPVIVLPDGRAFADPSNADLARVTGSPPGTSGEDVDLVIVGAGPAGLSAAVYGASEGLRTMVVDRGGIGGQASSSASIRNYLGFPRGVTGSTLAQQAWEQAWILGARFVLMENVTALERTEDGLVVRISDFPDVSARAVILATGAEYRRLGVPALEALSGAGVYYGGTGSEAHGHTGSDVFVLGGANSAGQAALHLAQFARRVTLVLRGESLERRMSHYLVRQLEATPNVAVRLDTEIVGGGGEAGSLGRLVLRDRRTGAEETVPADGLFPMIGADPQTGWLPADLSRDEAGFLLTGADLPGDAWPLAREPFPLETSMPGVLAVGDVRHGSVKRVASAVGEGSVAIRMLHQLLAADRPAAGEPAPVGDSGARATG